MSNEFKKGLIILGKENTGKSMLARVITSGYQKEEVILIDGRNKNFLDNKFTFHRVTERTKVILIDDLHPSIKTERLFEFIAGDLEVNRKGKASITVNLGAVQLIVTSTGELSKINLTNSIIRRFEIIEVKNCGYTAFREIMDEKQAIPQNLS